MMEAAESRDVTTGATGATEVAPKFSDTLPYPNQGGQILPTIAEVADNIFLWLRPWKVSYLIMKCELSLETHYVPNYSE